MGTPVTGYTNLNIDGLVTLQTGVLAGVDLTNDVTLTNNQMVNGRIEVTTGSASKNIILPTGYAGKVIVFQNNHASLAASIKVSGGSAVTVAATKVAILQIDSTGNEIKRVTADA